MIKDRLPALRATLPEEEESVIEVVVYAEKSDILDEFFKEVEEIKENIEKIQSDVEAVKYVHSSILSAPETDEEVKQNLEDLMAGIKRNANNVRLRLKVMQQNADQFGQTNATSANYRIRRTQHSMLSQKFVAAMSEYNKAQTDYREGCKARIQRQLEITGMSTTDEEIEQMLETGNSVIFTKDIITDTEQAKQMLADIEARHEDIMKLEKSIRELYDLFMDMALLVEQQGEMVDRIEYNVKLAVDYIKRGENQIKPALKYMSKARKKKIMFVVTVTVVFVVIVIIAITSIVL